MPSYLLCTKTVPESSINISVILMLAFLEQQRENWSISTVVTCSGLPGKWVPVKHYPNYS